MSAELHPDDHDHQAVTPDLPAGAPSYATQHKIPGMSPLEHAQRQLASVAAERDRLRDGIRALADTFTVHGNQYVAEQLRALTDS